MVLYEIMRLEALGLKGMNETGNYMCIKMDLLINFFSIIVQAGFILWISSCGSNSTNTNHNISNIVPITNVDIAFYISLNGSDSNSGVSPSSPWKTFAYAIPRLNPGDTLILMDGTYTKSTTGLPNINCGASGNAQNGTATQPITIIALNERQAFLQSDGSTWAFHMQNCSYWNIEGLHGASADMTSANGGAQASIFEITASNNINLRRLLADHTNRCFNDFGILVESGSSNVLIEESEVYYFHRIGIVPYGSTYVTMRRNYTNSRNYPKTSDPNCASTTIDIYSGTGDGGQSFYNGQHSIIEDGIDENSGGGVFSIDDYDAIYGFIAIHSGAGLVANAGNVAAPVAAPVNDFVSVNSGDGFYNRGGWFNITNATFYNSQAGISGGAGNGLFADNNGGQAVSPNNSRITDCTNCLFFNNSHNGTNIMYQNSWLIDSSNSYNNGGVSYNPSSDGAGYVQNSQSTSPTNMGLGTNQCIVYVPTTSNMHAAGKNGADIGANMVYRHNDDGTLSGTKLWDQTTGQFPCGGTVAGLNDDANGSTVATQACGNVHKRLNVGINGCPIP